MFISWFSEVQSPVQSWVQTPKSSLAFTMRPCFVTKKPPPRKCTVWRRWSLSKPNVTNYLSSVRAKSSPYFTYNLFCLSLCTPRSHADYVMNMNWSRAGKSRFLIDSLRSTTWFRVLEFWEPSSHCKRLVRRLSSFEPDIRTSTTGMSDKNRKIRGGHRSFVKRTIQYAQETLDVFQGTAEQSEILKGYHLTLKEKKEVFTLTDVTKRI